jgi:hypothetical protein
MEKKKIEFALTEEEQTRVLLASGVAKFLFSPAPFAQGHPSPPQDLRPAPSPLASPPWSFIQPEA